MAASKPTNIDHVNTYFQIPVLTKIHGEPTFETLRIIRDKIKANAGSITMNLGGGALGYLGLLLSPAEYIREEPGTPFIRPVNPGNLVIPPGTAQHAANRMQEDHAKALRIYCECIDVKDAMKKQVFEAIEPKFSKYLHSRLTQRVDASLEALFTTLFNRYGFITQQQLADHERNARSYQYNIQDPLSVVYDLIEDLQLLAEAARTPFSENQLVSHALEILRNTNKFTDGIKSWNRLGAAARTWTTFMIHFDR